MLFIELSKDWEHPQTFKKIYLLQDAFNNEAWNSRKLRIKFMGN